MNAVAQLLAGSEEGYSQLLRRHLDKETFLDVLEASVTQE